MKKISFPGLGLEFTINKIAINFFGIEIYWYAILIVIAFIIAILFLKKDEARYSIKFENLLEILLIAIPISIICSRTYFIIFNLNYYLQNPIEIFNFRNGGLAIYGGIIGFALTVWSYCKIKKYSFLDVLDCFSIYLPLGQAIGRWGNFFNVEAYGTNTNNIFRMGIIENGIYKEVHPPFLYESFACLLIFLILFKMKNKIKYKGQLTYIYLFLYGFVRSIIEGLRTDSLMIYNFRASQILSIILCITFGVILIFKKVVKKKNE